MNFDNIGSVEELDALLEGELASTVEAEESADEDLTNGAPDTEEVEEETSEDADEAKTQAEHNRTFAEQRIAQKEAKQQSTLEQQIVERMKQETGISDPQEFLKQLEQRQQFAEMQRLGMTPEQYFKFKEIDDRQKSLEEREKMIVEKEQFIAKQELGAKVINFAESTGLDAKQVIAKLDKLNVPMEEAMKAPNLENYLKQYFIDEIIEAKLAEAMPSPAVDTESFGRGVTHSNDKSLQEQQDELIAKELEEYRQRYNY